MKCSDLNKNVPHIVEVIFEVLNLSRTYNECVLFIDNYFGKQGRLENLIG